MEASDEHKESIEIHQRSEYMYIEVLVEAGRYAGDVTKLRVGVYWLGWGETSDFVYLYMKPWLLCRKERSGGRTRCGLLNGVER